MSAWQVVLLMLLVSSVISLALNATAFFLLRRARRELRKAEVDLRTIQAMARELLAADDSEVG